MWTLGIKPQREAENDLFYLEFFLEKLPCSKIIEDNLLMKINIKNVDHTIMPASR